MDLSMVKERNCDRFEEYGSDCVNLIYLFTSGILARYSLVSSVIFSFLVVGLTSSSDEVLHLLVSLATLVTLTLSDERPVVVWAWDWISGCVNWMYLLTLGTLSRDVPVCPETLAVCLTSSSEEVLDLFASDLVFTSVVTCSVSEVVGDTIGRWDTGCLNWIDLFTCGTLSREIPISPKNSVSTFSCLNYSWGWRWRCWLNVLWRKFSLLKLKILLYFRHTIERYICFSKEIITVILRSNIIFRGADEHRLYCLICGSRTGYWYCWGRKVQTV